MSKRAKPRSGARRAAPRSTAGVTFGEALREMRAVAQDGVSEAIVAATLYRPPPRAKGTPKLAAGHQAQALFEGICEALADAVVDVSRPGGEEQMAKLVGQILLTHVQRKICVGRC